MIFCAILKHSTPLAEFSEQEGDLCETLIKLWKTNKQTVEFYAFPFNSHEFCFLQSEEYTFSVIVEENTGK